ncbi:conserved hypothetical protein [Desulfatibacillum aliphaticivorans]|uniref:HTH cro/C1-type domain-containing protein n=1 Tax=Desulfatibacillum aliphaticivorans TaxID=218208 RepID=B8FIU9_DESAL|nr:helix-turn-helix transcriptional regulator [Desulfatibacillum aliphaticivorans]ACL04340.1 conserved hypothetical protein [Desulfatibacillum aliphaticivorans]
MDNEQFILLRKALKKTQTALADLLGVSVKAVHSYEQGWRKIPAHVERQMYFLISRKEKKGRKKACWAVSNCPPKVKRSCPAWEFQSGDMCWMIHGTQCQGHSSHDSKDVMGRCRECGVIKSLSPAFDDKGAGEGEPSK